MIQRRGLIRLLSSPPSDSGDVLVIPDDHIQQFEGVERASHQPIVPISSHVGVNPPSSRGIPDQLFPGSAATMYTFVPGWNF